MDPNRQNPFGLDEELIRSFGGENPPAAAQPPANPFGLDEELMRSFGGDPLPTLDAPRPTLHAPPLPAPPQPSQIEFRIDAVRCENDPVESNQNAQPVAMHGAA